MNNKSLAILFSMLAGVFVAVATRLNASLGERIGILESSFVIHLAGALFAFFLILLFFRKERGVLRRAPSKQLAGRQDEREKTPVYLFGGGVLGIVIVLCANLSVPKLGMVLTMGIFLMGNLIFAVAADHFGFFGLPVFKITRRRLLGLACTALGLMFVL